MGTGFTSSLEAQNLALCRAGPGHAKAALMPLSLLQGCTCPLLECGSGLLSRLLFLAQAVVLLLPAARAGLCPVPCSCRIPLLDCSRRKLPAPSWRALSTSLPPDAVSL